MRRLYRQIHSGASMLTLLLAATLAASPAQESATKHVVTGAAIGAAAQGLCVAASQRWERHSGTYQCALAMGIAIGTALYAKECQYDAYRYGDGTCKQSDLFQSLGGAAAGISIFIPLLEF